MKKSYIELIIKLGVIGGIFYLAKVLFDLPNHSFWWFVISLSIFPFIFLDLDNNKPNNNT